MKNILRRIPRAVLVGILVAALLITGALAYLSASGGTASNTFSPASDPKPTINENFNGTTKTNVAVNVGDSGYAVYVRAAIVVNWEKKDSAGTYHATSPVAGTDYTISLNTAANDPWFLGDDGFYYHKTMVAYDGTDPNSQNTAVLINSCQVKDGADIPDGYHLNVEIIAQTIQALGTTDAVDANGNPTPAVEDAWKVVTVDSNGSLIPITP